MKIMTRVIAGLTATLALGFAAFATVNVLDSSQPAAASQPTLKTADYNDGWTDGQADLADLLGHRMPNGTEYQALVDAEAQSGRKCHLEWDGPAVQAYEVICAR